MTTLTTRIWHCTYTLPDQREYYTYYQAFDPDRDTEQHALVHSANLAYWNVDYSLNDREADKHVKDLSNHTAEPQNGDKYELANGSACHH